MKATMRIQWQFILLWQVRTGKQHGIVGIYLYIAFEGKVFMVVQGTAREERAQMKGTVDRE